MSTLAELERRVKRLEEATERIEKDVTRLKDAAEFWRLLRTGTGKILIGAAATASILSVLLQLR